MPSTYFPTCPFVHTPTYLVSSLLRLNLTMKFFTALFALATAAMISAQVSPTHPFPDDPEELDRVTCGQNTDYNCL